MYTTDDKKENYHKALQNIFITLKSQFSYLEPYQYRDDIILELECRGFEVLFYLPSHRVINKILQVI